VIDLEFQFAAEDYEVIFTLDDRDVARVTFPVRLDGAIEAEG
jgi:hypothetical protein